MLNFEFFSPTRLVFGKGTVDEVGKTVAPLAKKVLIHYGSERIVESGLMERITTSLDAAGVAHVALGGVRPNPDIELAERGIELAKSEGVELVLCVGGGSVIDSGKAIALGVYNTQCAVWDIFKNGAKTTGALPVAAVLTFPAAGSEGSNSCVMSNYKTKEKLGCNCEWIRPKVAIVDPTLFATIPKFQIACGVADMMSHIMERYFSNTEHTELIDALSEATLRTLIAFGPKVLADPGDYDAWCQVAICGTIAHNNMLGVGRQQDWACHKMAHEVTARFSVTHGAALAGLTPAWMRYVWRANPKRFFDFSVKVMGEEEHPHADTATIEDGISALETFYSLLGLSQRLSAYGVTADAIPEMARLATRNPIGGLKRISEEDACAIMEAAL